MPDRLEMCRQIGAMTALRNSPEPVALVADKAADAAERAVIWAKEAGRMDAFAAVYAALGYADTAAQFKANAALYASKAAQHA